MPGRNWFTRSRTGFGSLFSTRWKALFSHVSSPFQRGPSRAKSPRRCVGAPPAVSCARPRVSQAFSAAAWGSLVRAMLLGLLPVLPQRDRHLVLVLLGWLRLPPAADDHDVVLVLPHVAAEVAFHQSSTSSSIVL